MDARRNFIVATAATVASAAVAPLVRAQATPLRVLVQAVALQPVYMARDMGWFAREGLEVEIAPAPTADAMIPQLLNGQAQIGLASGLALVNAVARGLPVKAFLSALNTSTSAPSSARLVVPPTARTQALADLKGCTIAVGGLRSQPHLMLLAGARDMGMRPTDLSIVEMPVTAMQAAALKGTLDAVYPFEPYLGAMVKAGFRIVEPNLSRYIEGAPVIAFTASEAYLRSGRGAVRTFARVMREAYALANREPDRVREVDLKYTRLPPEYVRTRQIAPFSANIDGEALMHMAGLMKDFGWIGQVPALEALLDTQVAAS